MYIMKDYKQDVRITSLDASIHTHNASFDVGIAKTSSSTTWDVPCPSNENNSWTHMQVLC